MKDSVSVQLYIPQIYLWDSDPKITRLPAETQKSHTAVPIQSIQTT